jgi:hypothetical protein
MTTEDFWQLFGKKSIFGNFLATFWQIFGKFCHR